MKSIASIFKAAAITAALFCQANALNAAPLPDGTTLLLEPGIAPYSAVRCETGSCFGMEVGVNFWVWTNIEPGLDRGFVIGKDQSCGGQEIGPSETNDTPGELTAAWFFFAANGTFCTNNPLNTFSDTSNDGVTAINDLTMAWNGTAVPLGGGTVDDYIINLDDTGRGNWRMEYRTVVPSGVFREVDFWLIIEGIVVPAGTVNNPPVVNDISFQSPSGATTNWAPDFTGDPGDTHTCAITSNGSNGNATVNIDCSGGTYTSGFGYDGLDSFEYTVTDQEGLSSNGIATVVMIDNCLTVSCLGSCSNDYPLKQVLTDGGGQSQTVNASMQTVFTGHIMTEAGLTTGGKSAVKICPDSFVDFETTSTVGTATCSINGAPGATTGTLTIGDKLTCTNKPDASDTDRFSIKSGF